MVTAELTADISMNGMPAAGCVSPPTPVAANGATTLTCTDPEAGLVYEEILAEAQAEAEAEHTTVPVVITATASASVHATANVEAEVRTQVETLGQEEQQAVQSGQATPEVPAKQRRIGDVSLPLGKSGYADPIVVKGMHNPWTTQDGFVVEPQLGGNLPDRARVFDGFYAEGDGVGISIKSIEPRNMTYTVDPGQIYTTLKGYIDAITNFRAGHDNYNFPFQPGQAKLYVLRVAYPVDFITAGQKRYLDMLIPYGEEHDVIVQLIPVKNP